MLNFKTAGSCFIIVCSAIALLVSFFEIHLYWFLLPIICFKGLIIYGSANIQSNFYINAFCNASTREKQIAITFDDGPNSEYTQKILAKLAEHNAPATFFVIGKNILGKEDLIRQMDAAGHTIGNHTYSHAFLIDFKSKDGFVYELNATSDIIFSIIKKRMNFFRPPYGVTTPNLARASKALKYNIIGWNIRSLDTTKDSEEQITSRVISKIKPGAIILFHDTSDKTIKVVEHTLNFAAKNGFKIVSVESLLKIKAYA
jgi:peptidoglycan/xylan/chitin deacetylase (PgdA/CDA1 family)